MHNIHGHGHGHGQKAPILTCFRKPLNFLTFSTKLTPLCIFQSNHWIFRIWAVNNTPRNYPDCAKIAQTTVHSARYTIHAPLLMEVTWNSLENSHSWYEFQHICCYLGTNIHMYQNLAWHFLIFTWIFSYSSSLGLASVYNLISDSRIVSNMPMSPADMHGMWYPTVRRTLVCLSKLSRCIDVSTFYLYT
jgi:hypothetical protein